MSSVQRSMCAGMLGLQAVVLLLTTPVLVVLTDLGAPMAIAIGLGLTVACIAAAGMMRRPAGRVLGWAIQVLSVLLGLLVPVMFVIGAIFLTLYAGSYAMGARIDRERAARAVLG